MTVTIKQIAKEAGVAVSSVSDMLHRNDPRYSAVTRRRVQETARRLGYRPNILARAMIQGKTRSIGVVGHDLATPLNVERLQAISAAARKVGYQLFLSGGYEEGAAAMQETVEEMLARDVDGLIIFVMPDANVQFYESVQARGTALVLIGNPAPRPTLSVLSIDAAAGMHLVTRHLLEAGHRALAYAAGAAVMRVTGQRQAGFQRALREFRVKVPPEWILTDQPASPAAVREFTRTRLAMKPRPTAILYTNDEAAAVGLLAAREAGRDVPREVSLVGYDDLPLAALTWPAPTTVRQPRAEVGELAVKMLLEQMERPGKGRQVVLTPTLVVRQSTAAPPAVLN